MVKSGGHCNLAVTLYSTVFGCPVIDPTQGDKKNIFKTFTEHKMASKSITKWALILNACLDLSLLSQARRQKSVGKVFGASTAVGHAFFVHALIRGSAGFNVESVQFRKAAVGSLLIELYYVLSSGKAVKHMRPMLVLIGVMIALVSSTLKKDFHRKKLE